MGPCVVQGMLKDYRIIWHFCICVEPLDVQNVVMVFPTPNDIVIQEMNNANVDTNRWTRKKKMFNEDRMLIYSGIGLY